MNKRVLVTGGSGTLGSQLLPLLQQDGFRVRISSRRQRPTSVDGSLEWAQAALEQPQSWTDALAGVDTVVHAASSPFKRGVDVSGTRHLLAAAAHSNVRHLVFISIVGVDRKDWYYYADKLLIEQLIAQSGIAFSILRTTQFHDFIHRFLDDLFLRFPIGFLPRGWSFQTINTGEVAALLRDAVVRGPGGRLPDAGGPEILTLRNMADVWMEARGRRPVIPFPAPFLMGKAFTRGHNLAPHQRVGRLTWREWVQRTLVQPAQVAAT